MQNYEPDVTQLLGLYQQLEDDIVADMVRRMLKMGFVSESTAYQAEVLQSAGILYEDILQMIADRTDASVAQVRALFEDAGVKTVDIDNDTHEAAGEVPVDIRQDAGMKQVLEAGYRKTLGTMRNLVGTTANTTQTAFLHACDRAYMQVSSGAFSYQEAIRMAVRDLADGGAYITYPTGHRDRIDVAVRRCVLTGVGQTAAAVAKKRAEDSSCQYMELTAHGGARPEHARWQGQLVVISGKRTRKVIDGLKVFTLEEIGYGDGRGFKGWNCRHNWHPYYPGLSTPNYTPEEIARLDEKSISYNGEKYTAYEISQMQRKGERKVRTLKRRAAALEEAAKNTDDPALKQSLNDDFSAVSVRLKDAEKTLKDFCRQTGQRRDTFREQVNGFGRSTAQRAVHAAKRVQNGKKELTSGGDGGIIKEKDMFHTKDDPIREVLGSAEQSHPEELQQFFDYLSEKKVAVIRHSGNSSMGYQPGLRKGEPGQIVMEDGASYSAWLHEVQHVKDDESEGWGGMATLFDQDKRWEMECNAYEKEIEFAKSLGRQDIVERLEILRENERKAIYGK